MTTMPLPPFEYHTPTTLAEAVGLLAGSPRAALVAGGTDLLPKMKRRQVKPTTLVSLAAIPDLRGITTTGDACVIGASTLLADLASSDAVPPMLATAAGDVASPQIRNAATIGGNLCLDTRCNWADMSDGWRQASGYCMKDGGETCWVAPRGDRCWAISSTDLAPVVIALDASVRLVSARGERVVPAEDLYRNDGIAYLTKDPDEILVDVAIPLPTRPGVYRKLRRRGSIDFPLLGVAAAVACDDEGTCTSARLVVGGVSSAPVRVHAAEAHLVGRRLTDDTIEEVAGLVSSPIRPQDNTDIGSRYRKWMIAVQATRALTELRS